MPELFWFFQADNPFCCNYSLRRGKTMPQWERVF
jgi:hypothetical protein